MSNSSGAVGAFQVWALRDAGDIVALHATEHGAHAAVQTYLADNAETDPDDHALLERSVHVTVMTVHQP